MIKVEIRRTNHLLHNNRSIELWTSYCSAALLVASQPREKDDECSWCEAPRTFGSFRLAGCHSLCSALTSRFLPKQHTFVLALNQRRQHVGRRNAAEIQTTRMYTKCLTLEGPGTNFQTPVFFLF